MKKVQKEQYTKRGDFLDNIDYVRAFAKIKIKDCCKKVKVDVHNLYNRKVSNEKAKLVKEEIENQIAKLYIKD